jgi:ClpP class serine protease
MLALAADEIVMDANAVLGPVDPQLGNMAAASILSVLEQKSIDHIEDETLMMADLARKAVKQVQRFVRTLLLDNIPQPKIAPENVEKIIEKLTSGQITHDCPISVEEAAELGLPIAVGLPKSIYQLMELYPQPQGGRPSVQYIPLPYQPYPAFPDTKGRPLPDKPSP